MKKVVPNAFADGIEGVGLHPSLFIPEKENRFTKIEDKNDK